MSILARRGSIAASSQGNSISFPPQINYNDLVWWADSGPSSVTTQFEQWHELHNANAGDTLIHPSTPDRWMRWRQVPTHKYGEVYNTSPARSMRKTGPAPFSIQSSGSNSIVILKRILQSSSNFTLNFYQEGTPYYEHHIAVTVSESSDLSGNLSVNLLIRESAGGIDTNVFGYDFIDDNPSIWSGYPLVLYQVNVDTDGSVLFHINDQVFEVVGIMGTWIDGFTEAAGMDFSLGISTTISMLGLYDKVLDEFEQAQLLNWADDNFYMAEFG